MNLVRSVGKIDAFHLSDEDAIDFRIPSKMLLHNSKMLANS